MPQGVKTKDLVLVALMEIYRQHPDWRATKLHQELAKKIPPSDCPKLRKTQELLAEIKEKVGDNPGFFAEEPEITPWDDDWPKTNADDIACLFRLREVAMLTGFFPLSSRVARWARRLRGLFTYTDNPRVDLDFELLTFAYSYAQRERVSKILKPDSPYTADLDGWATFRCWESPESFVRYNQAVDDGLIPRWTSASVVDDAAKLDPDVCDEIWGFLERLILGALQTLDSAELTPEDKQTHVEAFDALFGGTGTAWEMARSHPNMAAGFLRWYQRLEQHMPVLAEQLKSLADALRHGEAETTEPTDGGHP